MEPTPKSPFNLANGIVFEFNKGSGLPNPGEEDLPCLAGPHEWLSSMLSAKNNSMKTRELTKTINADSIKLLGNSTITDQMDATHQGVMQYMFHAWAKEQGCVLKPDMFFFTVMSEVKNQILAESKKYQHLFTQSETKTKIKLVNLTIDKLMVELEELMPCKELFDLVTNTSFSTEPIHFKQVMSITMADMGTPYFSYCTTKCGIPKIIVCGTLDDWQNLIAAICSLKNVFEPCCKVLTSYLTDVTTTLTKLVGATFVDRNASFFDDMFVYYENPKCGSGHTPIILEGWIKQFYLGKVYSEHRFGHEDYINRYPSHLNCLPYFDEDNPDNIKYYFYVAGMCSSRLIDGYLYPEYNIAHCKLKHYEKKAIYDILAANID